MLTVGSLFAGVGGENRYAGTGRPVTPGERAFIVAHRHRAAKWVAARLGRSPRCVQYHLRAAGCPARRGPMTPAELDEVRRCYSGEGPVALAARLGRNAKHLMEVAAKMGITGRRS